MLQKRERENKLASRPHCGVPPREDWFIVSALVLMFSYTVSNVVPFFEELTVIIGALIGGLISFGLPAAFLLRANIQVNSLGFRVRV